MRESDLGRMLLESFRAFEGEVTEAFAERELAGIRPSFTAVFAHIDGDGTSLSELARRASMTKQGMADLVEQMQEQRLVRRVPDPEDGRAKRVVLTAKGRRRLRQATRAVELVEGRVRRRLGDRRYEALRATLAELCSAGE